MVKNEMKSEITSSSFFFFGGGGGGGGGVDMSFFVIFNPLNLTVV